MTTVYLLIGLPGSGKTTFAKKLNAEIVSVDEVRQTLADQNKIGKTYSSNDNPLVFSVFREKIKGFVEEKKDVVVDSTNATLKERKEIYELLSPFKPKFVAVLFEDNVKTCLKRMQEREKTSSGVHRFENPLEALNVYKERLISSPISFEEPVAEIIHVKNGKIRKCEQKVLIASTNLGKIEIYADILEKSHIPYTSLAEINVEAKIDETGETESENALIKAKAYNDLTHLPIIANDSGLIIDRFSDENQPGVLVRRYHGKELSDLELLNLYIEKLNEVGGESTGHHNVALAILTSKGKVKIKEFKPRRYFISTPSPVLKKGIPLSSLAYDSETKKYLSEMTPAERNEYEKEEMEGQKNFIVSVFKNKRNRTK